MKSYVSAIAAILIVAAIYFCAARLGLSLAFVNASATPVWPPTGISLAAILLLGRRATPGIFLGAFLANLATAGTVFTSLGIASGNTLEAVVGAELVTRFAGGIKVFDRAQDVFVYVFAFGIFSTALSATVGVTTLILGGLAHRQEFGPIWLTWWLGDAVSAVVIAPLIIVWLGKPLPRLSSRQAAEAGCLLALLYLVLEGVFGGWMASGGKSLPVEYLVIPLLLWAVFRFAQHGAVTVAALMSAIAIRQTILGSGPFAIGEPNESLLFLQVFMGTVTVTTLVLAAVVTEREDTEKSLRASRAEFERASKAKDEFLAVLSHELRTPLTPVLLTVSLLQSRTDLPAEVMEDVATIRRNVELESQLIGDLLDLTRIERGKLQLDFHEVDVHRLVVAAADICRQEQSPHVSIELAATNHHVRGDSARLQQVFWNLINNAQKFTPPGGTIVVQSSDTAGERVRIEVADSGVGIDPVILPKLFTAFEQGDIRTTRQFGGLGLGLAISKKLVDAHGGTIKAFSSGKGRGATFVVELPAVRQVSATPLAPAPLAPAGDAPSPGKVSLRILLVEDHELTLKVLSKLLGNVGHRVTTASTFATATAAAHEGEFDLLISDLGLPDGSGLELLRQLRRSHSVPGIAVTGYGMPDDLRTSKEAGFAAHLIKPVDSDRLLAAIEEITAGQKISAGE
jgi:signal transduction histidine kinase/CheY-like chemotaxis protein